jgi:hypothetical protein
MAPYVYFPLVGDEIRLVQLVPGNPQDDVQIIIDQAELILDASSPQPSPSLMTTEELERTLPPDWTVHETVEDELCFYYETSDPPSWRSSVFHPDPQIDPSRYRRQNLVNSGASCLQYEALSYTWRSEHPDEDVIVKRNGQEQDVISFRIGGNLACALRSLRYQNTVRTLWIDAICINQESNEEKKKQVARMSNVYSSAFRVVVWLGVASADSTLAMENLCYFGKQLVMTKDHWRLPRPGGVEGSWAENKCILPYSQEVWAAIGNLLDRPWYSRVWIIQEIQLAEHGALLHCGQDQMPWSYFRSAVTCLWVSQSPNPGTRELTTLRVVLDAKCLTVRAKRPCRGFCRGISCGRSITSRTPSTSARQSAMSFTL